MENTKEGWNIEYISNFYLKNILLIFLHKFNYNYY